MVFSITNLLTSLASDATVHCIILSARGKFFCTGMDLSTGGAITTNSIKMQDDQFHGLKNLFAAIENAPQTTIADIIGSCFGGGVGLAMACDIRLAL
jgi:hydroxymethylglutaryl-CoA lyase